LVLVNDFLEGTLGQLYFKYQKIVDAKVYKHVTYVIEVGTPVKFGMYTLHDLSGPSKVMFHSGSSCCTLCFWQTSV